MVTFDGSLYLIFSFVLRLIMFLISSTKPSTTLKQLNSEFITVKSQKTSWERMYDTWSDTSWVTFCYVSGRTLRYISKYLLCVLFVRYSRFKRLPMFSLVTFPRLLVCHVSFWPVTSKEIFSLFSIFFFCTSYSP